MQNQNKSKMAAAKSSDGYLNLWLINQLYILFWIQTFEDISFEPYFIILSSKFTRSRLFGMSCF